MAGVFWYDGKWTTEEPRVVGPMDHAFWLGSVIFDGARAIKGYAPDLDRHCARAVASARAMLMKPTRTADEIEALCREGIRRMGPEAELYVRPMFFIRKGLGAARPDPDSTDFILAIYDSPLPKWQGFAAVMAPFRRPTPEMAPTDAKAACLYPNGARASAFAAEQGADNAVMCDAIGHVAEFASANLWFARDGRVVTPAVNHTFLNGVTRQRIIKLFAEKGVTVPCTRYNGRDMQIGRFATQARDLYFDWMKTTAKIV